MPLAQPKGHHFVGRPNSTPPGRDEFPDGFVGTLGADATLLMYFDDTPNDGPGQPGVATYAAGAGSSAMWRDNAAGDSRHWALTVRVRPYSWSAAQGLIQVRTPGGPIAAVNVLLSGGTTNKFIVMADATGAAIGASVNINDYLLGVLLIEMEGQAGTTTADGKFRGRVSVPGGAVIYDTGVQTGNYGVGNVSHVQMGKTAASPASLDVNYLNTNFWDGDVWSDVTAKYLPPAVYVEPEPEPEPIPDDLPGAATGTTVHTHLGRVEGQEVGPDEYPQVFGSAGARTYEERFDSVGVKFDGAAGYNGFVMEPLTPAAKQSVAFHLLLTGGYPVGGAVELHNFRTATANVTSMILDTQGRLGLNNGAGTAIGPRTEALPDTALLLVQASIDTETGRARLRVTDVAADDVLFEDDMPLALATGAVTAHRFGKLNSARAYGWWLDNLRTLSGVYLWTEPAQDASSAGPDQVVEPQSWVTLTGLGPGSWSGPVVLEEDDGEVAGFTAPTSGAQQVLAFTYGTDTMTVTVLPATESLGGAPVVGRLSANVPV